MIEQFTREQSFIIPLFVVPSSQYMGTRVVRVMFDPQGFRCSMIVHYEKIQVKMFEEKFEEFLLRFQTQIFQKGYETQALHIYN